MEFILFLLYWLVVSGMGVCLGMWLMIPSDSPLKKTDFPFPSSQLQIVCELRVWRRIFFLFSVPGPYLAWTCIGLMCAAIWIPVYGSPVCVSPVVYGRRCFLGGIHHLWLLQSLHFLPKSWGEGFDEDITFRSEWSIVSDSLYSSVVGLCVNSYLSPRSFSDEDGGSMGIAECHWESYYC